jgi:FtsP/CotA-like multicopper oxidase with cupredoxin domain
MQKDSRAHIYYLIAALVIFSFIGGLYAGNPLILTQVQGNGYLPITRHFTLIIQGTDLRMGPNAVWHAWTYNGTVPGPTLHAKVGDTIVVKVINELNLTHSFHTHLVDYNFSYDGSQANIIGNVGNGSMIPPGGEYTYIFKVNQAGIYYYHCHSSDHHPISYHIHQGLYGAIIVDKPEAQKFDHDWVIFMGEVGPQVSGTGTPPFIMNGKGIPGGEASLMQAYETGGMNSVVSMLNVSLPAFSMKAGETARISVINIGDQIHSFHLHDINIVSEWMIPGQAWPAEVVPLVPGAADSLIIKPTQPGIWLFHCHVVFHADAGMIGVLIVNNSS